MKKIIKNRIKNCITKYLLKYFNGSRRSKNYQYMRDHVRFYLFLRWLSEFVKNEEDTKHVTASIASYMYCNNFSLPFTDIFVVGDIVCICTSRPGMWIGKAGSTLDEITKNINFNLSGKQTHNFKITLLENTQSSVDDVFNYMKVLRNY